MYKVTIPLLPNKVGKRSRTMVRTYGHTLVHTPGGRVSGKDN